MSSDDDNIQAKEKKNKGNVNRCVCMESETHIGIILLVSGKPEKTKIKQVALESVTRP